MWCPHMLEWLYAPSLLVGDVLGPLGLLLTGVNLW